MVATMTVAVPATMLIVMRPIVAVMMAMMALIMAMMQQRA
jgi:hypothetical protein